jgi:hypothetical protein
MKTYDAHKTTTEVRQGNKRLMNLRVLVISLILIVLVFAVIYAIFAMTTPPTAI